MEKDGIRSVAIVGLGAMGAGYARQIAKNNREVRLYGIVRNLQKYKKDPIFVNGERLNIDYVSWKEGRNGPVDLVILAVKSYHLQEAVQNLAVWIDENTILLSLLNGLDSERRLTEAFGSEHVLYATVTGADTNRKESQVTCNRCGCLYFGEKKNETWSPRVKRVAGFLEQSGIAYQVPADMEYKLWEKFLINVGCNQTSTVYQMNYGKLRESAEATEKMRSAQREVILLARYYGVALGEENIKAWEEDLQRLTPHGRSSMLHDYWQGRPLETEILGDAVTAMAAEAGIPVPVNRELNEKIHEMILERNLVNRGSPATPDKIANQLRMDILHQKIKKGDKMAENQLAKRFSASRSSVRTALQILSNEGLILTHENGRREAVEFTEKQVIELYHFRWLLEQEALKRMLSQKNSIFPLIAEVLAKIEKACLEENADTDWYDLDVQFHRAWVRTSGNMFLVNAWESNAQLVYTLMNFNTSAGYAQEYADTFFDKHKRLYELCLSDGAQCFQELEKHIMDAEIITKSLLGVSV